MEQTLHVTPEILAAFGLSPRNEAVRLNGGHINDTFLVEDGGQFVLQRINHYVFPSPRDIMENIAGVTAFLREKIRDRGGDPDRETLEDPGPGRRPGPGDPLVALHPSGGAPVRGRGRELLALHGLCGGGPVL